MSTRGYDDTAHIAEIESLMQANPELSQRAAIIQVVGEGSLRRIQNKMARRQPPAEPVSGRDGDFCIQMGSTPVEMMLTGAERQVLAGSGERVRASGFTDLDVLMERLRIRTLGPGYKDDFARNDRRTRMSFYVMGAGIAVLIVMMAATFLSVSMGWRGDRLDLFVLVSTMAFMALLFGGLGASSFFTWLHERRMKPLEEAWRGKEIGDRDVRRYVLTDKALYVFAAAGRSVSIRRIEIGQAWAVSVDGEGDFVLSTDKGPITLEALPEAHVFVARLGLGHGRSGTAEGTLALA